MGFDPILQLVLLLGLAVAGVLLFQRLQLPSVLAYLLVGVVVGPHTLGPVLDREWLATAAEFGIVFLLFTLGLSYSPPQLRAMRGQTVTLGLGQVAWTTFAIGLAAWLLGLPAPAAFVVGVVFAQSSTTLISRQLTELGQGRSQHGMLGTAMSVLQDITTVPFVLLIPALGVAGSELVPAMIVRDLARSLGLGLGVIVALFVVGRWALRPFFHVVAERGSRELFTLTVLLVSILAAWSAQALGLSMAFGAFLAGMLLGETEFRHQVEASIRPFRDVLLGAFFISVGMLLDPGAALRTWLAALGIATCVLGVKAALVFALVRRSGLDRTTAWRTGILLAVGGEFGFALLAIGLEARVLEIDIAQTAFLAIFLTMVAAPFLIRWNHGLARRLAGLGPGRATADPETEFFDARPDPDGLAGHVILCGYGRIGQGVGRALEREGIPYVALDLDPSTVRAARLAGEPIYYGDASDPALLDALGLERARLVLIGHTDATAARRVVEHVHSRHPSLPVMVRTHDEGPAEALRAVGASEVVTDTLETGLALTAHALLLLEVPPQRVLDLLRGRWGERHRRFAEFLSAPGPDHAAPELGGTQRLWPVVLPTGCAAEGQSLGEAIPAGLAVTALVRGGTRHLDPAPKTLLMAGDVLVLCGDPGDLRLAEAALCGAP